MLVQLGNPSNVVSIFKYFFHSTKKIEELYQAFYRIIEVYMKSANNQGHKPSVKDGGKTKIKIV